MTEPTIAFAAAPHDEPGLEVRINFGVFAGRQATPAEIDRLAERLLGDLDSVTIVAEERNQISPAVEASVEQVCIELASDQLPPPGVQREELQTRLVWHANAWARECIADRHHDPAD